MEKEKEIVQRNIELSTEFSRYLFEHPELEDKISPGVEIVLLPEFDPELKIFNLELGRNLEESGTAIVYIRITKLKPKILSRIEEVKLGVSAT
jgi:hypothetical protein